MVELIDQCLICLDAEDHAAGVARRQRHDGVYYKKDKKHHRDDQKQTLEHIFIHNDTFAHFLCFRGSSV